MAQLKAPTSKYLSVQDVKIGDILTISKEPVAKQDGNYLEIGVFCERIGDKLLYDYTNKFKKFFDAYGEDSINWLGARIEPILPTNGSVFFAGYKPVLSTEEPLRLK